MQAIATKDAALIKSFMTLDSIWDSFSDDMSDKREYHANIGTSHLWLKVFIDGEMGGMIFFRNETLTTLSLHPYLLPKYRKLSRELIKKALRMFLSTPDFINKITVSIPSHRRVVYNLAKKIGFIDEGVNRESFLKDGIYRDQWNLGLTKKEIRGLLWRV